MTKWPAKLQFLLGNSACTAPCRWSDRPGCDDTQRCAAPPPPRTTGMSVRLGRSDIKRPYGERRFLTRDSCCCGKLNMHGDRRNSVTPRMPVRSVVITDIAMVEMADARCVRRFAMIVTNDIGALIVVNKALIDAS